jgi:hypothetical protein
MRRREERQSLVCQKETHASGVIERPVGAKEQPTGVYSLPSQNMQRTLLLAHTCSRGLLGLGGECQQTTRLHDVCEEPEPGLISTKDFAYQDETQ